MNNAPTQHAIFALLASLPWCYFRKAVIIITLRLLSISSPLYAQENGIIKGYVLDAQENKPIPYANVIIQGTIQGAATNEEGFYEIKNVTAGDYLVETKVIGYKNQIRGITVNSGDIIKLDFGLVPTTIEFEEIRVGAQVIDPLPIIKLKSDEIIRMAAVTTADLLKEIPGVSTSRSGGWGTKPYIQGMTDSRLLVLVDGAKVNQACPLGMDACTATIAPAMIENIEIQKGPGSAQYGSGNLAGVINISTVSSKYSNSPKFRSELSYSGKYKSVSNSRTGMISYNGGNNVFNIRTGIGFGLHDDYQTKKGFIKNSGFNSSSLHLKTGYRPTRNQQALFTAQIYRAEDIGWPASNTLIPEEKRDTYTLNYTLDDVNPRLPRIEGNLSYQPMYHKMINYLPGDNQYSGDSNTDTYNLSMKSYWLLSNKHTLTTGTDYSLWLMRAQRRNVDSGEKLPFIDILPNSRLGELGIFIQDEFKITNRLKTQIGIRSNYINSNADQDTASILNQNSIKSEEYIFSGSAAILYNLKDDIVITASLSKGFKTATPVERYITTPMLDGYYRVGNPNLASERNINGRIGISGMRNRFNWNIEIYNNDLADLISAEIDTVISSPFQGSKGVKRFVNVIKARIIGGSAFVGISFTESLFMTMNVSYDWGEDRITGKPIPALTPIQSTSKLTYDNLNKGYWFELSVRLSAPQNRYAVLYGEKYTPGYGIVNFKGGWKIRNGIELSAGIDNIFNKYYRDHLNQAFLPEPGRDTYFTLNLTIPDKLIYAGRDKKKEKQLYNLKEIIFVVEGMACHFCVNTVRERISALPGVVSTIVDLKEETATVIIQEGKVALNELVTAVERAGFKAILVSIDTPEKITDY